MPLLVLALAIIVLPLAVGFSSAIDDALLATDLAIWAVFASDLCGRTYLVQDRVDYLKSQWLDVLPFLRLPRVLEREWVLASCELSTVLKGRRRISGARAKEVIARVDCERRPAYAALTWMNAERTLPTKEDER